MDRGAWWATVHGVTKESEWLSDYLSLSGSSFSLRSILFLGESVTMLLGCFMPCFQRCPRTAPQIYLCTLSCTHPKKDLQPISLDHLMLVAAGHTFLGFAHSTFSIYYILYLFPSTSTQWSLPWIVLSQNSCSMSPITFLLTS